ncbi:MAG: DUF6036 family nucleotidyltransferase [Chthoniobacterales bacterium]
MRAETDRARLEDLMVRFGTEVKGPGRIYLTGGSTAVLYGWRSMTIDVDIKADPEPPGLFEAIVVLKESIGINIELAAPDDFIPALPGWRDRSLFILRSGEIDFLHYDFYAQALAKLERGHARDMDDVDAMLRLALVDVGRLRELFEAIEPELNRYPAIDPVSFRVAVVALRDPPRQPPHR